MAKQEDTAEGEDGNPVEIDAVSSEKELRNALYARCASQPADKIFNQNDLLSLEVIPNNDLNQLLSCTRRLTKEGLFKLMSRDGRACWKVVKREDAAKYQMLNPEEALVFSYIESSGREGIWTRILRARTNLHMSVMNQCLKKLEKKNYVKPIKSVKFPGRKTYMLSQLQPSEDVTGGPYYTDGMLDEEFVHQMAYWTEKYVSGRSWWHPPIGDSGRRINKTRMSSEQAEDLRAAELSGKASGRERSKNVLPMPAGYIGYPTIPDITKAINISGLSPVVMKEAEMKQLLDVLCWDGRLQRALGGKAYKATRPFDDKAGEVPENGLTEAPCGRCPVSDICEEGGPVNARTCEYFQQWLEI